MGRTIKAFIGLLIETIITGIMFASLFNLIVPKMFSDIPTISSAEGMCIIGLFNFLCASKEDNKVNKDDPISYMIIVEILRYALYGIILLIINKIFL